MKIEAPASLAHDADRKVKVKATIAGQTEADAEVEVTLSVKCGTEEKVADAGKMQEITGNGSKEWEVTLPDAGTEAVSCTAKATAEGFTAATHEITVAKVGAAPVTGLVLVLAIKPGGGEGASSVKKSTAGDDNFTVTATITKDGTPATASDLSGYTLKINWSCDGNVAGTEVEFSQWDNSVSGDHQLGAHSDKLDANCKLTGELDHATDGMDKSAADVPFKFID